MWERFVLVVLAPVLCSAYIGGGGYDDYTPPAPVCKKFTCPKGEKPVGNANHKLWSYGCDSGVNFITMNDLSGMNDLGGKKKPSKVNKCCIERDICKQTCGTTSQECHNNFQACSKKVCKGDQNCKMAAMMGDIGGADDDPEEKKDPPEEYNYEKDKQKRDCRGYEKMQKSACACVPKDDWQISTEANLKTFYSKYNPEKLDENGDIKDVEEVWKKWKDKEPAMFQALATKYKDKAVTIKEKPKPPPYKPPPPLSKEEQEKEDKRMAEQREKWRLEDEKRDEEKRERERRKAEEKEEEEERRRQAEEGEEVEL